MQSIVAEEALPSPSAALGGAGVAAGVDVVTAGVVELDELDALLVFVLDARWDFFCTEGLQVWHLKVASFALRAVSPAQCRCDQEPHVSHWTIWELSSVVSLVPRLISSFRAREKEKEKEPGYEANQW